MGEPGSTEDISRIESVQNGLSANTARRVALKRDRQSGRPTK